GFGECASCRAVVLAGGRCFTVNIDDIANMQANRRDAYLIARDAYSGLPLWKLNLEATYGKVELDWRNVWPIVATDRRVYTTRRNELIVIAAATGKVEAVCQTKFQPRRLLLLDGSLVAGCWEKTELSKDKDGFENDGIRSVWWPGGEGTVEAFDEAGKSKWSQPLTPLTMAAGDGMLYVLTHKGNPPTERQLVGLELATGKEKWRLPNTTFGEEADTCLNFAGPGCAVVSKSKAKPNREAFVLEAADGKVRFTIPKSTARSIVGRELWCDTGRYDLATGKKLPGPGIGNTYAGSNVVGGCVPPVVVGERMVTASRGGGYVQYGDDPTKPPAKLSFGAARGACLQGMVPANGMFYTAQNNCGCFAAQVGGFIASGPAPAPPTPEEFATTRPVEKGPAFGATGPAASADDWPMYRQNVERSAGVATSMPDTLKVLWKVPCAAAGDALPFGFAEAWASRIGSPQPLTAPIVAAGMVIVAGFHSGQVIALKPDTGAAIWKASLASRIDSPPTYHKGLLLVGCHDGWAYALRATDGQLAYRVRIAPAERRMVDHGVVESLWPATGAVLVYDGLAYATAGRSTQASGGIAMVAFKPDTGETVWTRLLGSKQMGLVDVVSVRDGELAWHTLRMDPKTGADLPPAQKFYSLGSMIDGSWSAGFGRRSGGGLMLGRICSSMMAWNGQVIAMPGAAVARAKADIPKPPPTAGPKHPDPFKPEDFLWRTQLEPHIEWAHIIATAVTGNTAFYAGEIHNGWQGGKYDGSRLWIKSAVDGKTRQPEIKLDCSPCYDGLAVGGERVYLALQDGTLMCLGR
ncbi:MAG: PQQ-binding-like beta-propeller repeat protein, partial [Phycisphaerae bacterium]|nr:PQQ-binding-like beta-propeller repeat protein [Phycisphaerae bacterium]